MIINLKSMDTGLFHSSRSIQRLGAFGESMLKFMISEYTFLSVYKKKLSSSSNHLIKFIEHEKDLDASFSIRQVIVTMDEIEALPPAERDFMRIWKFLEKEEFDRMKRSLLECEGIALIPKKISHIGEIGREFLNNFNSCKSSLEMGANAVAMKRVVEEVDSVHSQYLKDAQEYFRVLEGSTQKLPELCFKIIKSTICTMGRLVNVTLSANYDASSFLTLHLLLKMKSKEQFMVVRKLVVGMEEGSEFLVSIPGTDMKVTIICREDENALPPRVPYYIIFIAHNNGQKILKYFPYENGSIEVEVEHSQFC